MITDKWCEPMSSLSLSNLKFCCFVEHRLKVLIVDDLVAEAVEAHKNGEVEEVEVNGC